MGLDVALGVLVLLAAVRGWFRGFLLQAIRLGGLVACVYLADPVRDLARPMAREHLATISPELLDKLLWWAAAVASYVVMTGVATWLVRAYRRHPYGESDPHRGDQSAGALL
ncbi:MAG TPA: CvpA family protein, partial [Isosphaeraceae bacterium]